MQLNDIDHWFKLNDWKW